MHDLENGGSQTWTKRPSEYGAYHGRHKAAVAKPGSLEFGTCAVDNILEPQRDPRPRTCGVAERKWSFALRRFIGRSDEGSWMVRFHGHPRAPPAKPGSLEFGTGAVDNMLEPQRVSKRLRVRRDVGTRSDRSLFARGHRMAARHPSK